MSEHWDIYADWNPWHGCTKISPGCKYCYVYRQDEMYGSTVASSLCRKDLYFYFFTKRINRLKECLPPDWGDGYDNVLIGCTVENQQMADFRLPIFKSLPVKHKSIIASPLLSALNLEAYLDEDIEEVSTGGESGLDARICDYQWILDLREQCVAKNVPFRFHQTGARLLKNGKLYRIPRRYQLSQAHKANIDFRIGKYYVPETADTSLWKDSDYHD